MLMYRSSFGYGRAASPDRGVSLREPATAVQMAQGANELTLAGGRRGRGAHDRPSRRTAFSLRISGRTSSLSPACSKSASQRSGVISGKSEPNRTLVSQQRVRVLHELRREVLRRPAGEVDVDLRACGVATEIASSCHGNDGCARMIFRSREVDRHVVDVHRVRVLEPDAAAAGQAGADAGVAGVEERRAARPPRSPRRAGRTPRSFGKKAWMFGWNLKPRTPWSRDQPAGLGDARRRGAGRAGERDQHVGVGGRDLGDLLVRDRRAAGLRDSASTVKTTAAMLRSR